MEKMMTQTCQVVEISEKKVFLGRCGRRLTNDVCPIHGHKDKASKFAIVYYQAPPKKETKQPTVKERGKSILIGYSSVLLVGIGIGLFVGVGEVSWIFWSSVSFVGFIGVLIGLQYLLTAWAWRLK